MLTKEGQDIWIKTGYEQMARQGMDGLRIDQLAKMLGRSRSGFYHRFNDIEGFEDALLEYHLDQVREFCSDAEDVDQFNPEYIELVVEHKDMTFFIKQLFLLQQSNPKYAEALGKSVALIRPHNLRLWKQFANLNQKRDRELGDFFEIIRDTFLTRIDYDTFTEKTFLKTLKELNISFNFLLKN